MIESYKSTCPLDCWDACGLIVKKDKNKIVDIAGDKEHGITKGFICSKGKKHIDRLYHPDRIKTPLIKKDGVFHKSSWDEALDIIATKIKEIVNTDSKKILYYSDSGHNGVLKNIESYFFNTLGNITVPVGSLCWSAGMAAQELDFGTSLSNDYSDLLNSKLIILWGRNPADTAIHQNYYINKASKNGAKVIVIDPIMTKSAKQSDEYITIKPGTDGALALAMANQIIFNNSHNTDFIDKYVKGFEHFKSEIKNCTASWAEKETGINESKIVELAETYSETNPASILIGYGIQRYTNSGNTVRAIDALAAITGNIGISGGGANYANKQVRPFIDFSKISGEHIKREHREFPKAKLAEFVLRENNPKIDLLFVTKANPFVQCPDTNNIEKAFKNIDLKIVIDLFMTDTAKNSDIVLPCTSFLEEEDIYLTSMGHSFVSYSPKVIENYEESKSEREIFNILSEKLNNRDFPRKTANEWLKIAIEPLEKQKKITMEMLKDKAFQLPDTLVAWEDKKFLTPSGKYELYSEKAIEYGLNPTPEYVSSFKNNFESKYDLFLITPHHKDSLHSQHFIDKKDGELAEVYINPETAKSKDLCEDSIVKASSPYGELNGIIKYDKSLRQDTIYIYEGQWVGKGGSVNTLISNQISDIGMQAALYESKCMLEKV